MWFRIQHDSWYRYDVPVALAEHVLRLTPRAGGIRLLSHQLRVEPEPSSWRNELDELGNARAAGDGIVPADLEEKAYLAKSNCPEFAVEIVEEGEP